MFYVLISAKRVPWTTIARAQVSRQVWRCVAVEGDYTRAESVSQGYHDRGRQVSVVHESSLRPELVSKYKREAKCAFATTKT